MSGETRTRGGAWATAGWLTAIAVALLALAGNLRWRLDLTEEGLYTLDPATRGLLGRLEDRLQVKLYFNRDLEGVEGLLPQRLLIEDFLEEARIAGGERMTVETVDPTTDLVAQRDAEHVGIMPLQVPTGDVGELGVVLAYQGLEMRYLDRSEVIPFTVPSELEFAFAARLSSLLRPRRPEIAFFSREPALGPPVPGMPRNIPPARIYQELRGVFAERTTVRDVELADPAWRSQDTAALVVARPSELTEDEVAALDRYLAEGGRVLLLADREQVELPNFRAAPLVSGLDAWLDGLGVRVAPGLVYDEECLPMQVGVDTLETQQGRRQVPKYEGYPFIPVLRGDGLNAAHAVTAALGEVTGFWMHPIETSRLAAGLSAEVLLQTSAEGRVLPPNTPLDREPESLQGVRVFARQSAKGREVPVAVAIRGTFPPSHEHTELQPAPGVLVLIGDSDLFHNGVLLNQEAGGAGNAAFAANLGDWLTGDEALIGLRSRGRMERRLADFRAEYLAAQGGRAQTDEENRVLDREAKEFARARERTVTWGNVLLPPLLIAALAAFARWRRRRRAHEVLAAPTAGGGAS
jgi:ABC-type uncharacterized transport system involved in gliding motility auxiliary subunit